MLTTLLLMISLLFPIDGGANPIKASYHQAEAKAGDGVLSILRRYKLSEHNCNIDEFYKLNNLKKNQSLFIGNKYKLPLKKHKYNGTSIRTTLDIKNYELAVQIKEYNDMLVANKIVNEHYTMNTELWVPHHFLNCNIAPAAKTFASPTTVTKGNMKAMSIFGDKYANVEVVDKSLKNNVYYIVAGHGGPDPGAVCSDCSTQLCEDEYAYDVALRLARDLEQHGAKVEIIVQDPNDGIRDDAILKCDYDEFYVGKRKIPKNPILKLQHRAQIINHLYSTYKKQGYKKQQAIMLHVDSNNKAKTQDVFFCYFGKSKSSKQLAQDIQQTFKAKYERFQKGRGYKGYIKDRSELYMLRNTAPPAVLIELANIQNRSNHQRLKRSENRQALANWIFEGLIKS